MISILIKCKRYWFKNSEATLGPPWLKTWILSSSDKELSRLTNINSQTWMSSTMRSRSMAQVWNCAKNYRWDIQQMSTQRTRMKSHIFLTRKIKTNWMLTWQKKTGHFRWPREEVVATSSWPLQSCSSTGNFCLQNFLSSKFRKIRLMIRTMNISKTPLAISWTTNSKSSSKSSILNSQMPLPWWTGYMQKLSSIKRSNLAKR